MATNKLLHWVPLLLLLCLLGACRLERSIQGSRVENANARSAPWLSDLIDELETGKPTNPPARVYRYSYNDQIVYYITGGCCDIPGRVYNSEGKIICEADGGITGRGDGRCPDFFEKRSNETLIWEDKRK